MAQTNGWNQHLSFACFLFLFSALRIPCLRFLLSPCCPVLLTLPLAAPFRDHLDTLCGLILPLDCGHPLQNLQAL